MRDSRLRRALDVRRPSWVKPPPMVGVDMGRWLHAGMVRFLACGVLVGCTFIVTRHTGVRALAVSVAILILVFQGVVRLILGPLVLAVIAGYLWPTGVAAAVLVFGAHLHVVLITTTGDLPASTRVELAVFGPSLLRFAGIQLVAQGVLALGVAMSGSGTTIVWLPAAAALALGAFAWWMLSQAFQES